MNTSKTGHAAATTLAVVLLLLAGPVAATLPGIPALTTAPWGAWITETVDDQDVTISKQVSLALDADDNPHISYSADGIASGAAAVWYARNIGNGWEKFLVSENAQGNSLAIGPDGVVHIVYVHLTWDGPAYVSIVKYARWDGSTFVYETIENPGTTGGVSNVKVAAAGDGRVHATYDRGDDMRHATKPPGGSWTLSMFDSPSFGWHDMAVDSQGRVHVAHVPQLNGGFSYALRDTDGSWTVTRMLSDCRNELGIDTDSADYPHVSCHSSSRGLVHAWQDATGWHEETVDDGYPWRFPNRAGYETDLVVDGEDRVHISYTHAYNPAAPDSPLTPSHMMYAMLESGSWWNEEVDRDGSSTGRHSSVDVDSEDRPSLAYIHGWRRDDLVCITIANPCYDVRYAAPLIVRANP